MLDEVGGQAAEGVHVRDERPRGFGVGLVEDGPDRAGSGTLDLGRQRAMPGCRNEEGQDPPTGDTAVGGFGVAAHAPLCDHRRRDPVGRLEVVRRATSDLLEQDLLGSSTAHQGNEAGAQVGLGRKVIVLLAADRHAERLAVGEEADFLDPPLVAMDLAADRVTDLVGGDDRPLSLVHRPAAGRADRDLQPSGVKVLTADHVPEAAGRHDRGLVEEVGQLGAGEAIGLAGHLAEVDRHRDRLVASVNLEDRLAAFHVRQPDVDLAVEAPGPEDGRVEDVEAVRRRNHDDVVGRSEPVELDKELVERLLALFVAVRTAAGLAEGVELVEEDDPAA